MEGPLLPLALRGALLVVGTVVAVAVGQAEVLGPAIALLVVVAFAAIPLPSPTARMVQAFAEAAVLGLVIGSIGPLGPLFLPLLLLPVFSVGLRGGVLVGAAGGVTGCLGWALGVLSTPGDGITELSSRMSQPLLWLVPLAAVGAVAGWVRRLTLENQTYSDTAYEQAFRLLTELQEVARDLSLGLDPPTLATALLDDVARVHPHGSRTLSVVSGDDRLSPLARQDGTPDAAAGAPDGPSPGASIGTSPDDAEARAWRTRSVQRVRDDGSNGGSSAYGFPVTVGDRVVAVLGVRGTTLDERAEVLVRDAVAETGPKLAAALLFDDVRRLATVDERLRLAREIHDGIAQEVASLGYLLDDVVDHVPPQQAEELRRMRDHVRRVVSDLRLSIFDLRAGVDDTVGLGTALSEHVQRVGQQSELVVHTVLDEFGERLPPTVEVELLRIAQEAITNVRKHAQAGNLWVECTVEAPRAWLRVADDGVGPRPAGPGSMGLRGMRERVRRIGGELHVGERNGGGTVVEVTLGRWDEETGTVG